MSKGADQPKSGTHLKQRLVVEYGVELDGVWLPIAMLRRLSAHGPWDKPFTEATADQERVLLAHSLADRHNRSGLHRGAGLPGFIDAIPFEPTVPFPTVPDKELPDAISHRETRTAT
jgi:hypothetical protein